MIQDERRILGVDPGTNFLGYALISIRKRKMYIMEMGTLKLNHLDSHPEKLQRIFFKISSLIDAYKPTELSIEAPFYGKNPQSMLKLGRAQGAAIAAAAAKNLSVVEYAPKLVKKSVTGNGNASKEQVKALLVHQFGRELEVEHLDTTDALSLAVCHYYQVNRGGFGNGTKANDWSAFIKQNPDRIK